MYRQYAIIQGMLAAQRKLNFEIKHSNYKPQKTILQMAKKNTSISIESEILKDGQKQAKAESRSFSSLVQYLLSTYLTGLKNQKRAGKK